jgi:hypothetical protein
VHTTDFHVFAIAFSIIRPWTSSSSYLSPHLAIALTANIVPTLDESTFVSDTLHLVDLQGITHTKNASGDTHDIVPVPAYAGTQKPRSMRRLFTLNFCCSLHMLTYHTNVSHHLPATTTCPPPPLARHHHLPATTRRRVSYPLPCILTLFSLLIIYQIT